VNFVSTHRVVEKKTQRKKKGYYIMVYFLVVGSKMVINIFVIISCAIWIHIVFHESINLVKPSNG
jgi:hypothetical protein